VFDCDPTQSEAHAATLRGWFGNWLESLRRTMTDER
jgi:hypothetical protein